MLNLPRLIGEMERCQEIAYVLEEINVDTKEEIKRKQMVRDSIEACRRAITDHLDMFLKENPSAVYEDWIRDLHPDNALFAIGIDHRFYVEDSDHRHMWNQCMEDNDFGERIVESRHLEPSYRRKT